MKHQLIILVGGVERVCARGVRCNTTQDTTGQPQSLAFSQNQIISDKLIVKLDGTQDE